MSKLHLNWKPVNPDSRLPGYLQSHTKENMIWQLKLLAVFMIVTTIWDKIEERRFVKKLKAVQDEPKLTVIETPAE